MNTRKNKMIRFAMSLLLLSMLLMGCSAKDDQRLTIGVVQLVQHPALDATVDGLKDFLRENNLLDKVTIVVKNAQGDPGIALSIAQQFVNDDVDLIYAIATPAAQAAFNATIEKQIPIVFNAVTDPVAAGIADSLESSNNHVTGVSDAAPLELQLALIREMLPNAKRIGLLFNLAEINGKIQVEQVKELAPKFGLEAIITGVSAANEIDSATSQLVNSVDAIYNITDNMIASATSLIVDIAFRNNIPVFGAEDGQMDQGLLAVEGLSYFKLGQQAGPLVKAILFDNVHPSELPITTAVDTDLRVSLDMAQSLNIDIPQSILDRLQGNQ